MVSNKAYIKMVNDAVRRGEHIRPIKIVFTKTKPTVEGVHGVSSHQPFREHDRISVWKGLAKNRTEQVARSKKLGRKVITREQAIRHELWHVHEPHESEKKIRKKERRMLPMELPVRRRFR